MTKIGFRMDMSTAENVGLIARYTTIRQASLSLCDPLKPDDYGLQAMPETSPPKWHLAHTSWFFETFILKVFVDKYTPVHPQYEYLFNSYYHLVGKQFPRANRGLLSRPTIDEVLEYRKCIDESMQALLADTGHRDYVQIMQRCELGLEHEQQHQELLCTDIKYSLSINPLYPAMFSPVAVANDPGPIQQRFMQFDVGTVSIGHQADSFYFDNERPVYECTINPFLLATRLVNNTEYQAFVADGGYQRPELWLADGWYWKEAEQLNKPLYWVEQDGVLMEFSLYGLRELCPQSPVSHVSYYEADAYARWCDRRLPTEQEWEAVAKSTAVKTDKKNIAPHPRSAVNTEGMQQLFGSLWQWTMSPYSPYPGYRPAADAIGEYNGKFMCNQFVLRGSSCVTPPGHARATYRNFFYPKDRWQFTGIRLADDC